MSPHKFNRLKKDKNDQPEVNLTKYELKSISSLYILIGVVSLLTILFFVGGLIRDSKSSMISKMSLTNDETVTLFEYQEEGINIGFVDSNEQFSRYLAQQIELDLDIQVNPVPFSDLNVAQKQLGAGNIDLILGGYSTQSKYADVPNISEIKYGGYSETFLIYGKDFELVAPFNPINFSSDSFDKSVGINYNVSEETGIIDNISPNATIQFMNDETASSMIANGTLDLYISNATSIDVLVDDGNYVSTLADSMYIKPTALFYNTDKPETGGIFEEYFSIDTKYNHIKDIKTHDVFTRTSMIHANQLDHVTREITIGLPLDNVSISENYFDDMCGFVGLSCSVIEGSPKELKDQLAEGSVDVVFPLSLTNEAIYGSSPIVFSTDMVAIVHTDYSGNELSSLVMSPQTIIGVVAGTYEAQYASEHYVANKIILYNDSTSLLKDVDQKNVEVALTTLPRLAYYYNTVMFTSVIPTSINNIPDQVDYVIKYRKDDTEMAEIVDVMLHVLNNTGGIKEIRNEIRLINSNQLLLDSKIFESKVLVAIFIAIVIIIFAGVFIIRSLRERSLIDPLTQLQNRHGLQRKNQRLFGRKSNNLNDYVLCYIDVNNFKSVNDVLGHNEGDNLLKKIGTTLIKYKDLDSFRIGGDEFALIYRKREHINIERIAADLNRKIEISGLNVGVSIGIVDLKNFKEITDFDHALDFADYCMYIAKAQGTRNIVYANIDSYKEFIEFAAVDTSFAGHLEGGRIIPVFQPTVDLQSDKAVGFEVLGRKVGDHGELISVYKYINNFRSNNSFAKLDVYMFEEACKFLSKMKDMGNPLKRISVNFDPKSFMLVQPDTLVDIAKKYKLSSTDITLELTEGSLVNDVTFEYVRAYKNKGFSLALDDFSAGHSSLQYITKIDFDYIKIDKSLVDDVESGISTKVEIFRSLLELFRSLGKVLVIEGVENANQIDLLEDLNVHYVQGYYYSKPLVAEEAIKFYINKNKS